MDRKRLEAFQAVAKKSHRVLTFVLISLFILAARIWYLSVSDREGRANEANRGRYRQEIISAPRGTIRDRFSQPLAVNQVEYRLSIVWADIAESIPRKITAPLDGSSEKKWRFLRREYIAALSKMIAKVVPSLTAQRVQDLIYSYAVYSHTVPVVVKTGLTEEQYCQLSAKSPLWPGLRLEIGTKRYYPYGKSLCHVVGYTAPIQREEYEAVLDLKSRLSKAILRYEIGDDELLQENEEEDPLQKLPYDILKKRLKIVERKLYSMHDSVGRTGIEASFESALRGLHGKRVYETNARGDVITELSDSKEVIPGKRVSLTVSLELQKICEDLLVQSEADRALWLHSETQRIREGAMNPFIRGGSIVALDANNGDILALASIPRYDLNDFSSGTSSQVPDAPSRRFFSKKIRSKREKWLQNSDWIGKLWDGSSFLEKEVWNHSTAQIEEENVRLSWGVFLSLILPQNSPLHSLLSPKKRVFDILQVQRDFFRLRDAFHISSLDLAQALVGKKQVLETILQDPDAHLAYVSLSQTFNAVQTSNEILTFLDLSRLIIRCEEFDSSLEDLVKTMSVENFRSFCQTILMAQSLLHDVLYSAYEEGPFQEWRTEHETPFLRSKRVEERDHKRVNKPYVLYLDKECDTQFKSWWQEHSHTATVQLFRYLSIPQSTNMQSLNVVSLDPWVQSALHEIRESFDTTRNVFSGKRRHKLIKLVALSKLLSKFSLEYQSKIISLATPFCELDKYPLEGKYGSIRRFGIPKNVSHLVHAISSMTSPPIQSLGYMLSSPPGSVFKLVTASALLRSEEKKLSEKETLHPKFFTFNDHFFRIGQKPYVGNRLHGEPVPQIYKGGRIPKSLTSSIGEVDLLRALEFSSNPYFALAAAECLSTPQLLEEEAYRFGFGEKTGVLLPGEAKGSVPTDLIKDKTAVYTTAIGQHTLLSTPLQVATMLSAYASQGSLFSPKIASTVVGSTPKDEEGMRSCYEKMLKCCGLDFSLWMKAKNEGIKQRIWVMPPKIRRDVELSKNHRNLIFQGMQRVVSKMAKDTNSLKKVLRHRPGLYNAFQRQKGCMLAKTSTAESYEALGLPYGHKPFMYSHTGIGALFSKEPFVARDQLVEAHPDIVVVVSLSYGSYGKEAGPIAAKVVEEWRKISQKYSAHKE